MTPAERNYAALILLWARTLPEHKLTLEDFIVRKAQEQRA